MNWDWEKLNARKPRQRQTPPPGGPNRPDGPDFEQLAEVFKGLKLPHMGLVAGVALLAWLASGFYVVDTAEVGVVMRFGKYHRQTAPGWNYHLPFPIEQAETPNVLGVRRVEVGFATQLVDGRFQQGKTVPKPEESLMLTGDENLVDVQFVVQYRVKDPVAWLFNVQEQDKTVKHVAEAAVREVVGSNPIDGVLTDRKLAIQDETRKLMQTVLNQYQAGLELDNVQLQDVHPPKEVVDAFKDVASAREEKSRIVNEARAYESDILPRTRGEAARIVNDAKGFKEQIILKAQGEAARFDAVREAWQQAPDITVARLHLEAMERILGSERVEKIVAPAEMANATAPWLLLANPPAARQGAQAAPANLAPPTQGAPVSGGKP